MKEFSYYQPSEIVFGRGKVKDIGGMTKKFGDRCLLVTVPIFKAIENHVNNVKQSLKKAGIEVIHFDGVVPNPTTDSISAGAKMAVENKVDYVIGLGGGSSMDTAKAIAVECTHEGTAWDYLFFKKQPTEKTLPVVAVTTTSGTGSQVTQVSVLTNSEQKSKSAIFNSIIYPKLSIVDPELMISVPKHITGSTGFDAFTHAFESYINVNCSPYVEVLALEAMRLVIENLPEAVNNGGNVDARENLAWADTLAGLSIANAGVTLPHGIGMTIGGFFPKIMHGEALAIVYPEFMKFTYKSSIKKFAKVARMFDNSLEDVPDEEAAKALCEIIEDFLKKVDMWLSFETFGVDKKGIRDIADHSHDLPDYKANPRLANIEEIYQMLMDSYTR